MDARHKKRIEDNKSQLESFKINDLYGDYGNNFYHECAELIEQSH